MALLEPAFDDYAVGLPNPGQLETPAEILAALRQLEAEESQIDEELSAMMGDRALLETLLDRIDSVRPVVEQVQLEAGELARRVDETADVAERISGKVRQLDLEQSRVLESIEMVQAVQDLKTSLAALASAREKGDFEAATRSIQRAMAVDKAISGSAFAEAVVPTGELPLPPLQAIEEFRASLLTTFLREFERASSERDEANTSRFFKLFPMIAAEQEGLDAYAKFVCGIVSSRSKGSLQQQASSPTFFASLLTPLFEQIALIISQHQPVVEKYYGAGRMLPVAAKLQEECDRQANAILSQWEEERRPSRRIQETQRYRYPHLAALAALPQTAQPAGVAALKRPYQQLSRQGTQTNLAPVAAEEEAVDPRDIDALLTELSQISGRWQLYRRFLYGRLSIEDEPASSNRMLPSPQVQDSPQSDFRSPRQHQSDISLQTPAGAGRHEATLDIVEQSSFRASLDKQLLTVFEPLELWYLRSSLEKAHQLNEPDTYSRPFLSSSLDDAFFILKKVLLRLVTCASLTAHRRMCSEVRKIMDRDFGDILRRRMDSVWSGITSTAQAARAKEEDKARQGFIVYANDLDTAADYIARLVDDVVESESLEQSYFLRSEYQQAREAIEGIKTLQDKFRSTLKSGLDQLFNQLVRPRLRPLIAECYKDVSYVLDEDSYGEAEYQDVVRKRFVKLWESLVEPYRETFTPANYQTVFSLTISVLARLWELHLKSMRVSELGALRFDRDLRSVTSFLSSQSPYGVSVIRESFSRLQQIANLLGVETASDADDLATSNGWKLSQQDMSVFFALKT